MCQLSVFAGGWTLESAASIFDGNILELTSALVNKSLIIVNQENGALSLTRGHSTICAREIDRNG